MNVATPVSAEPHMFRTEAEQALIAGFEHAGAALPGGPDLAARRQAAFVRFQRAGLPHRRVEEWKYTDLRAIMRQVPPAASSASRQAACAALASDRLEGLDRARIVIANGDYRPDLSDLTGLDGVTVTDIAPGMAEDAPGIGALFSDSEDPTLGLNTMFAGGGTMIAVAPGAVPRRPLEIVHLTVADAPVSVFARSVVEIGEGASVRVIESHYGPPGLATQTNIVIELVVGAGATAKWAKLQAEGEAALHIGSLVARLDAGAALDHVTVTAGAAVSRTQAFITLAGEGGRLGLLGATMLAGRQHGDATLSINHVAPGATSRIRFKNAVADRADGAFQGRISVAQAAQKTDGKMMTQTLLLSEEASFALKPELEIFADDVQCGHGATSGQIDEDMLFYFLSRGIPRDIAERLLVQAFLSDALEGFGDEEITEALEAVVARWLADRTVSVGR